MDERPIFLDILPANLAPHFREGEWEPEIHLPVWKDIFKCNDDVGGWIWAHIGEIDQDLQSSQIVLLDWLIEDQEVIGTAVRDAVLRVMPKIRLRFEAFRKGSLPATDAEAFDATRLVSVFVHDVAGGSAVLGVEFWCAWDEHGIGVLWRDGAVLGVSDGDAAINGWMGNHAAQGKYDFLYPLDPAS